MALNTRNNRASVLGWNLAGLCRVWPHPDGSLAAQGDRQHVAYVYRGILAASAAAIEMVHSTAMLLTGVGR